MWRCECGCLDRVELKYKSRKRGEDGKPSNETEEKVEVSWRHRQAVPLQSLGKAQTYVILVVCSECQADWDRHLTGSTLWKEHLELERAVYRMEIESHGKQLPPNWEAKRVALLDSQEKLRELAVKWREVRKGEVTALNESQKADVASLSSY